VRVYLLGAVLALTPLASSCTTTKHEAKRGELVLVLQTDLSVPKDVSSLRVEVLTSGRVQFAQSYLIGKAPLLEMPGALSIVAGDNPTDPVSIRILARQVSAGADADQGVPRVLREIITTVPPNRTAMLPVTLQWLCADEKSVLANASGDISTACAEGQTCVAGTCTTQEIDSATLPDFTPEAVSGAPEGGGCFDVLACLANFAPSVVDPTTCSLPAPAGKPAQWNVGLRFRPGESGTCDAAHCFVPLDFSETGQGWSLTSGGSIQLPPGVCGSQPLPEVVVSTSCDSKLPLTPVCGAGSRFDTPLPVVNPMPPIEMPPVDLPTEETVMLSGIKRPWNVVVEPQGVFFAAASADGTAESVYWCALAGCNSKAQSLWQGPLGTRAVGFAHNLDHLVIWGWTDQGMQLHGCPFPGGCSSGPSNVLASSMMSGQLKPMQNMLAFNGSNLVFREGDPSPRIMTCNQLDTGCGAASMTLVADHAAVSALALAADQLLWTNQAGELVACTLPNCTPTQQVLLSGQMFVSGPVISGTKVVWASDRAIRMCERSDCANTLRDLFMSAQPVTGLAADASFAYFGFFRSGDQHDIVKIPLDNSGLGQTLRSGTGQIQGLGVNDGFVYSFVIDAAGSGELIRTSTSMMAPAPIPMP
jgi:hypothetical protein